MKKIITYQTETGGVAVVYPANGSTIEQVIANDIDQGVEIAIITADDLPDTYFRNAWEFDPAKGVKVNVEKAKEIQRDVWRRMRKPLLDALDLELMKALEASNTAKRKEVADRKQALRDVTDHPLPDDISAIKSTIPPILTEP